DRLRQRRLDDLGRGYFRRRGLLEPDELDGYRRRRRRGRRDRHRRNRTEAHDVRERRHPEGPSSKATVACHSDRFAHHRASDVGVTAMAIRLTPARRSTSSTATTWRCAASPSALMTMASAGVPWSSWRTR